MAAQTHNREVEAMRGHYANGEASAVEDYNELVLGRSEYLKSFRRNSTLSTILPGRPCASNTECRRSI